jgi:hypothetical protein
MGGKEGAKNARKAATAASPASQATKNKNTVAAATNAVTFYKSAIERHKKTTGDSNSNAFSDTAITFFNTKDQRDKRKQLDDDDATYRLMNPGSDSDGGDERKGATKTIGDKIEYWLGCIVECIGSFTNKTLRGLMMNAAKGNNVIRERIAAVNEIVFSATNVDEDGASEMSNVALFACYDLMADHFLDHFRPTREGYAPSVVFVDTRFGAGYGVPTPRNTENFAETVLQRVTAYINDIKGKAVTEDGNASAAVPGTSRGPTQRRSVSNRTLPFKLNKP